MPKETTKSTVAAPVAPATPAVEAPKPPVALPATTLEQVKNLATLRSRKNRQTGTRINLWGPIPSAPDKPGTSTFVVQCQDHGTVVNSYTTRKAAKATVYLPQHWCDGCAKHVTDIQAKAAESVKAAAQAAEAKK